MIPNAEIKEMAAYHGIPTSSVERDYAQSWLLASLSSRLKMAFKGGTSIKKMHLGDYRFSDDLDFTLLAEYTEEQIREAIVESIQEAKAETGIAFEGDVSVKEVTNGFRATVGFRILRSSGAPINIKLDLTKPENESMELPPETLPVIHPYSDGLKAYVPSYSLNEILSEKVRSLFQRTRPRDLYDVWKLSQLGVDVTGILKSKFDVKGVDFDIPKLVGRKDDFENAWNNSLQHQISNLPECGSVFNAVIDYLHLFDGLFPSM